MRILTGLFQSMKELGHVIDLVDRVDEHVNVVGHEDIGKNGEIVFDGSFVKSLDEEFANAIVE